MCLVFRCWFYDLCDRLRIVVRLFSDSLLVVFRSVSDRFRISLGSVLVICLGGCLFSVFLFFVTNCLRMFQFVSVCCSTTEVFSFFQSCSGCSQLSHVQWDFFRCFHVVFRCCLTLLVDVYTWFRLLLCTLVCGPCFLFDSFDCLDRSRSLYIV